MPDVLNTAGQKKLDKRLPQDDAKSGETRGGRGVLSPTGEIDALGETSPSKKEK